MTRDQKVWQLWKRMKATRPTTDQWIRFNSVIERKFGPAGTNTERRYVR